MFGGIFRTPTIYGNAHRILQTPTHVVFQSEMIHESRIIPLDGRARPSSGVKVHFGSSRGYWDGHSLVIETTNFIPTPQCTARPAATSASSSGSPGLLRTRSSGR